MDAIASTRATRGGIDEGRLLRWWSSGGKDQARTVTRGRRGEAEPQRRALQEQPAHELAGANGHTHRPVCQHVTCEEDRDAGGEGRGVMSAEAATRRSLSWREEETVTSLGVISLYAPRDAPPFPPHLRLHLHVRRRCSRTIPPCVHYPALRAGLPSNASCPVAAPA